MTLFMLIKIHTNHLSVRKLKKDQAFLLTLWFSTCTVFYHSVENRCTLSKFYKRSGEFSRIWRISEYFFCSLFSTTWKISVYFKVYTRSPYTGEYMHSFSTILFFSIQWRINVNFYYYFLHQYVNLLLFQKNNFFSPLYEK